MSQVAIALPILFAMTTLSACDRTAAQDRPHVDSLGLYCRQNNKLVACPQDPA